MSAWPPTPSHVPHLLPHKAPTLGSHVTNRVGHTDPVLPTLSYTTSVRPALHDLQLQPMRRAGHTVATLRVVSSATALLGLQLNPTSCAGHSGTALRVVSLVSSILSLPIPAHGHCAANLIGQTVTACTTCSITTQRPWTTRAHNRQKRFLRGVAPQATVASAPWPLVAKNACVDTCRAEPTRPRPHSSGIPPPATGFPLQPIPEKPALA